MFPPLIFKFHPLIVYIFFHLAILFLRSFDFSILFKSDSHSNLPITTIFALDLLFKHVPLVSILSTPTHANYLPNGMCVSVDTPKQERQKCGRSPSCDRESQNIEFGFEFEFELDFELDFELEFRVLCQFSICPARAQFITLLSPFPFLFQD